MQAQIGPYLSVQHTTSSCSMPPVRLILTAKARALLHGRLAATREDIIALAAPVMRHRLLLSFAAEAEGRSADDVVAALLRAVPLS